jgi:hypothetical protein
MLSICEVCLKSSRLCAFTCNLLCKVLSQFLNDLSLMMCLRLSFGLNLFYDLMWFLFKNFGFDCKNLV